MTIFFEGTAGKLFLKLATLVPRTTYKVSPELYTWYMKQVNKLLMGAVTGMDMLPFESPVKTYLSNMYLLQVSMNNLQTILLKKGVSIEKAFKQTMEMAYDEGYKLGVDLAEVMSKH